MKSIAPNDNRRIKQTMLHYFKPVTIFRDKHYPNRSVRDALCICSFNITISLKRYVSYLNKPVHVISFKLGYWKNITFKISLKRTFTSSSVSTFKVNLYKLMILDTLTFKFNEFIKSDKDLIFFLNQPIWFFNDLQVNKTKYLSCKIINPPVIS